MKKICFITGTRADYGLIKPVIDEFRANENYELQLIVTGAHLSNEHGHTVDEIKNDGVPISAEIEMIADGDNSRAVIKSMSRELAGLAHALDRLRPDLMFIAGDRYEMLIAASACLIAKVPIAHLYGGDITEGAFDDAIRHAITKMSHLHFVSNDESRRRVIQMGEQPEHVFTTGSPSLDKIKTLKFLDKKELEAALNITFRKFNLLITFHPETLSYMPVEVQITEFIDALSELDDKHSLIITMPNADPEGEKIRAALSAFAEGKNNVYLFESLGYLRYFSVMSQATMVVGNSSSGIYETPSFKIPTVNIGGRQRGRLMAKSVVNCACDHEEITNAIKFAKNLQCEIIENPYGNGGSSKKIVEIINKTRISQMLLTKKFYDIV